MSNEPDPTTFWAFMHRNGWGVFWILVFLIYATYQIVKVIVTN